jgi:hypothetical protein
MAPSLKISGFIAESLAKIGVLIGEFFDVVEVGRRKGLVLWIFVYLFGLI